MDSEDDFDEILPEARIFDNRVDDIWNEKQEAYEKLLNKNRKEAAEAKLAESTSSLSFTLPAEEKSIQIKPGKRTSPRKKYARNRKNPKSPIKVPDEQINEIIEKNAISLSAAAKRKLKKLQLETDRENQRVQRETDQFLSSLQSSNSLESSTNYPIEEEEIELKIQIKIRYRSEIYRITVGEKELFESIFKKVADQFNLKPDEIILCLGDKSISLTDTPQSLELKIFHIIDCIPYKHVEEQAVKDARKLSIIIQSNDSRKKTELKIDALEKFEVLMKEYSRLKNIPLENLVFVFDGEKIEGSETPTDLEMESGICIDVKVLNSEQPEKKKQTVLQNFTPIPASEMLEIYDIHD